MSGFFDANLKALAHRSDPGAQALARLLSAHGPATDLGLRSRTGVLLPGITIEGTPRSLVSTFDQEKEAARWVQDWPGGTVIVFGGAGTAAAGALRSARIAVWVEPRPAVWASLFTFEDWAPHLERDEWVPWLGTPAELRTWLLDRYHPLWDGALRDLEWRAAAGDALWGKFREAVRGALDAMASDFSTQARFGARWYRNALVNLKRLKPASVPRCKGAEVVVAGAGPTLDDALGDEGNRRWLDERAASGNRLFATDTALPALTERGIVPDLVLCLDGQLPSYHHFVPLRPAAPLAADLASLPLLDRLGMPVVRYLSGHPFGTVIRRTFPELPVLDGSLGNVSGLARWTALALGARKVVTWGVDFAYRDGQAYAHGTYVYTLAGRRQHRLAPLETLLGLATYAARGRERTVTDARWDTTSLLRDYRARWEAPLAPPPPTTLAHEGAEGRWPIFAADWRHRIETLPLPPNPETMSTFVRSLRPDHQEDWRALGPLALGLHRETGLEGMDLLKMVQGRALSLLED